MLQPVYTFASNSDRFLVFVLGERNVIYYIQGGKVGVPITNPEPIFFQITNHVRFLKHFTNHVFNIHHCKEIVPN